MLLMHQMILELSKIVYHIIVRINGVALRNQYWNSVEFKGHEKLGIENVS